MLYLVGTLPLMDLEIHEGEARLVENKFMINDRVFPINRGTASMMAACCAVCEKYGLENPRCLVSGDIGKGDGSATLYRYLRDNIPRMEAMVITLHYIMPNLPLHNEVLEAIKTMEKRPFLIADAGYMYIAKMSGHAPFYDLFTPDLGELAFLADKKAPHPFYTRGFIFHMEDRSQELIRMAYEENNAAQFMCVKGQRDYICKDGQILDEVYEPDVPELEAIGGTGDTITGIIAALIYKGISPQDASTVSAKVNRLAGKLASPTPATQIGKVIEMIPPALDALQLQELRE